MFGIKIKNITLLILGLICFSTMFLGVCFSALPHKNNNATNETTASVLNQNNVNLVVSNSGRFYQQVFYHSTYSGSMMVPCPGVTNGNGWSTGTVDILLYKNGQEVGKATKTLSATESSTNCPSCGNANLMEIYSPASFNISHTFNVSGLGYGDFSVKYQQGSRERDSETYTHAYRGKFTLNANGGSLGTSMVEIATTVPMTIKPPTRANYTFNGYYTASSGGIKIFNTNGTPVYMSTEFPSSVTSTAITLYAQWTKQIAVNMDPNGGVWGSTGNTSAITNYMSPGTSFWPNIVSQEGYKFKGWAMANQSVGSSLSNVGRLEITHTDPFFKDGNMSLVYNNLNNGNVVHERITKPTDLNSRYNTHVLKISNTGLAQPGLGGYVREFFSYANAEFYTVIQAKIPVGYSINWTSNEIGTGAEFRWLTPNVGTGDWQIYVHYVKCGATGTFRTANHIYLSANTGYPSSGTTTNPINWYVASSAAYDATGMGLNPDTYVNNMTYLPTYTCGNMDQTLVALYESDTWNKYAVAPTLNADGYYHISMPEHLAYFAKLSKTQNVTAKIKLVNDIDLSAHFWEPIGNATYAFTNQSLNDGSAVFDGQGNAIQGLKNLTSNLGYQALFGNVKNKATIKNVTIRGKITWSGSFKYYAGLVAYGHVVIDNCINYVSIGYGANVTGGILGEGVAGSVISNCVNNSNFEIASNYAGGIVCNAYSMTITNCVNNGNMTISTGGYAGGIVAVDNGSTITKCINIGKIERSGAGGGIIFNATGSTLIDCINYGEINQGYSSTGGIICYASNVVLTGCVNNGVVKTTSSNGYSGGIIAQCSGSAELTNCYNGGSVSSASVSGGIIGAGPMGFSASHRIYLMQCYNSGDVIGSTAGGLLGVNNSAYLPNKIDYKFENCGVSANLTTTGSSVGGLIGSYNFSSDTKSINNCFFIGNITFNVTTAYNTSIMLVGGLSFADHWKAVTTNTYCSGSVKNGNYAPENHNRYTTGIFSEFSYFNLINNGLPVPKELFWMGEILERDALALLKVEGFTLI